MNQKEIYEFVNNIDFFSDLEETEKKLLIEKFTVETYNSGIYLFKEDKERKSVYIIYAGDVELLKKTPHKEDQRLFYFTMGDVISEGAFIDNSPHSTSAKTITACTIFSLARTDIELIFAQNPKIGLKISSKLVKVISKRMRSSNMRFVSIGSQYLFGEKRLEHDLLGEKEVSNEVYYGIQTLRALENFDITGVPLSFYPEIPKAFAMVKQAAARANYDLELLDEDVANAIDEACTGILNGKFLKCFVVDMIQGGAGTSTNMNANEVIANAALVNLGYEKGQYEYCHPNNHVNLSQSTNDAYPTAVKIAIIRKNKTLVKALLNLISAFKVKADEFSHVLKMGRTQLQDAVPMTLGQSFEANAITLEEEVERLTSNVNLFLEVNMGATAIGTGINSDPDYTRRVIGHLRDITGMDIVSARNLVEATQDTGAFVMYSSTIKRLAIKLSKISNDLRLLSSGPRAGLNEINLPAVQPGSSIMPGKVNPVIPEVVNQIAFKVIGNDLTVSLAAEAGQLELNVMEPVIIQSIFESMEMLINGMNTLRSSCIVGITANIEHCRSMVMNSIGIVTALNPVIGYEASTQVAKEALETGKSVYELVLEKKLLSKEEIENLLSPENMLKPRKFTKNNN
ncbi:MAG: aspartate ammonia-lyase [Bacteroidales bacterium]|nr:aspartate ammonia-lyase [Bacteroidales bacterium]MBN2758277.1 aspartate ammonia-lyase [Bacteroidales bacterium]